MYRRVPHLSHNCHSPLSFATLDFAWGLEWERDGGGGVLLISNSKHSRGLYMNFEYLIAKVSQKEKDREREEKMQCWVCA